MINLPLLNMKEVPTPEEILSIQSLLRVPHLLMASRMEVLQTTWKLGIKEFWVSCYYGSLFC